MRKLLHMNWTEDDARALREHIARGGSVSRAAVKFRRSERAMRALADDLGLKFPTIRQLRARAMGSSAQV